MAELPSGVAPIVVDYLEQRLANPDRNPIVWDEIWPYWARWVAKDRADGEYGEKTVAKGPTAPRA